jgi:dihydroorotase
MNIIIRSARIIAPNSPFNHQVKDILIEKGIIKSIGDNLSAKNAKIIAFDNLHISPGWFDTYAHFCDPGLEHKETLKTGARAAIAGGYTGVLLRPDTVPAVHSKSEVQYIINESKGLGVDIYPMGSLTKDNAGSELTEMYDLYETGAKAISNAETPLDNGGLLLRGLQYLLAVDGVICYRPLNSKLADGAVNEGEISVQMGMKGSPALSEDLAVYEALNLAEYTGSKLHLAKVSTAKSVMLIREFKRKGVNVTASVSAHHLLLDETNMLGFDENLKVTPPLRTRKEINALLKGLADGTIDMVCSDHSPQDIESKEKEFEYAEYGIIGLETCFGVLNKAVGHKVDLDRIIESLAIDSRKFINLNVPKIAENEPANLTLFDPDTEYVFEKEMIKSKSKNTPFAGETLKGKVYGIINKSFVNLNQ